MVTRRKWAVLLLAVDAGRWWLADSARRCLRSAVGHLDERWYWFRQWALCHLGPAPGSSSAGQAMGRLIRRENDAAEWEATRGSADSGRGRGRASADVGHRLRSGRQLVTAGAGMA